MKYIVTVNGKDYEVEVEKGQATVVKTSESKVTNIHHSESAITAQAVKECETLPSVQMNANGEPLKAPLPGIILDIKISNGAKVKRGDVLFMLEAMKMENEITATKDGIVRQVLVTKGTSVATGDILAVIQ